MCRRGGLTILDPPPPTSAEHVTSPRGLCADPNNLIELHCFGEQSTSELPCHRHFCHRCGQDWPTGCQLNGFHALSMRHTNGTHALITGCALPR